MFVVAWCRFKVCADYEAYVKCQEEVAATYLVRVPLSNTYKNA